MLLGKRSRNPIKRTTSMTGITVDVSNVDDVQEPITSDPPPQNPLLEFPNTNFVYDQRFLSMVSPTNPAAAGAGRSGSTNHVVDTAPFLWSCCLCNRRLSPGRDIYMYRGDTAFCSLECRERQMKHDERKEKLNVVASKEERPGSSTTSKASTKAEHVAGA